MDQPIDVFKKAKLRPKHVAPMVGVSRVTASLWLNGHSYPHHLIAGKVANLAQLVSKAMDDGKLPIPDSVSKSDEVKYLEVTLSERKTA